MAPLVGIVSVLPQAKADTLSAIAGLAFARKDVKSPTPILGVEYTFDASSRFKLGGFYDYELLSYVKGAPGAVRFRGLVTRLGLNGSAESGPFIFGKAGLAVQNVGEDSSTNRLAYGVGAGYQVVLSKSVSLNPRFGVRVLPETPESNSPNRIVYDSSLMVSFRF